MTGGSLRRVPGPLSLVPGAVHGPWFLATARNNGLRTDQERGTGPKSRDQGRTKDQGRGTDQGLRTDQGPGTRDQGPS